MKNSMIKDKQKQAYTVLFVVLTFIPVLLFISGCGVRNANVDPGEAIAVAQFNGRTVAILPVHGDDSMGTDSQLQLKKKINANLEAQFAKRLPWARLVETNTTIRILNKHNKLAIFDELVEPYKSVGVFNNDIVESLFKLLKCDYLVISELDNENIDVVAANAYLLSLDVLILNRNNEIVWSGTGDFKQGGMFGIGRVSNTQGAKEVVDLAFAYWRESNASVAVSASLAPVQEDGTSSARRGNPQVRSVQKILNDQGYSPGAADGFMGKKTRLALKTYQKDENLPVTGQIDNPTLVALGLRQPSAAPAYQEKAGGAEEEISEKWSNETTVTYEPSRPNDAVSDKTVPVEAKNTGTCVTTADVDLQETNDFFADSVVAISAGTTLEVLSEDGDWYKVSYKERVGYVPSEFVEKR